MRILIIITTFLFSLEMYAQDSTQVYKKRVLESTEIDIISSYYAQDGENAAVSGGIGSEKLTDATGAIIISIPLNDDDVLAIDAGISAYTSASSSNVNPFDTRETAGPFTASSGASSSDTWTNFTVNYSHSSDDRNNIVSAKASVSSEYDYFSVGFGGGFSKSFNEKNTELGINANVYIDSWSLIYPTELRPFAPEGNGLGNRLFGGGNAITGNKNYAPSFETFSNKGRNSYALGLTFSQILSQRAQAAFMLDVVKQQGLLSTPFQRVYFSDVPDSFIEEFHLADDIERLPDNRLKLAMGSRVNFYINEFLVLRTFYRYYTDDWGIDSHTATIELPIKISGSFTLYPSYRFYNQSAADYFAPYEQHLSTEAFYTSDYDLSDYNANQYGFGITYTDIFTRFEIRKFGLKSIDLKYNYYKRNTGLHSGIISAGLKFVRN